MARLKVYLKNGRVLKLRVNEKDTHFGAYGNVVKPSALALKELNFLKHDDVSAVVMSRTPKVVLNLSFVARLKVAYYGLRLSAKKSAMGPDAELELVLTNSGARRLQVIKVLREFLNLGLKEAKDMSDKALNGMGSVVLKRGTEDELRPFKAALEAEGALTAFR